ncbi:Metalloenzyme, LuxS/M16 peptidase-like protein [Stachybotrys elegans]|uniref:Metalloenzyme, LuxS/M16 peptidase-like protein n=1 Tax=Stachybotrys elegans TaxID=80388 RepID=A0A8K0WIW8_9HYPO|nr:Metalloenzyme, LuxS/M16 peptidase-like protein [Stachybotrys elegans]
MSISQPNDPGLAHRPSPAVLSTNHLEKSSLDNRDYRVMRLENELEILLVHDPETDKASAALTVGTGYFSDENGMPGIAHAVEHTSFMGTKKYPIENEYSQYVSSNSGDHNACTTDTFTSYFFDVAARPANDEEPSDTNPSPLRGALDRFAQFFIEPLFLSSTLDRELRAVDSENKKNSQNDYWRLGQLERSLSNPKHPYGHFPTGNMEVLKTKPEAEGINVRDKFIEFHDKKYSANLMKLVVLGRESLDVLEKWVVEFFATIVNKNLPRNIWDNEVPFREDDLGMQCFAKPVKNLQKLNLFFPFIDEESLYDSQPGRYISHLIGHKEPGSIMCCIKAKGWANDLSVVSCPVCPGTANIFEVEIKLTEEGLKNYPEILKIFFQYVSLLKETLPQEWIFTEQQTMADIGFRFQENEPASEFTSKISAVMHEPLPREWLLSGRSRLRKFDPKLIETALAQIRPDNFCMTVVSRNFPGNWDKKEKWYGTEYRYEKIPDDLMNAYKEAAAISREGRFSELHLPHKNKFIPSKLEVEKKEVAEPALAPCVLRNDTVIRTWWKKDDTFWVPRANVIVRLKSPIIFASSGNALKARLFTELVGDALEEDSHYAELAGLRHTVMVDSRGLSLEISGYNDKLHVLLEQVAATVRDIEIKEERFLIAKERLTRDYDNWLLLSAYQQVEDYMSWLNAEQDYIIEELATELPSITVDDIRLFHKQALSQLHIEVYAHGNMYKSDALKVTDMVESILKPRALPGEQVPIIRSLVLPPGSNLVYHKTLKDPDNVNHCIETWYYVGDKGDRQVRAKTLLFDQMVHEPAYDQLRTKEQLGYIVFTGMRTFSTTCGFRVLIQSERTPAYLDSRIEAFLEKVGALLENMSEADFEGHKRSLIIKRLEKLTNLDQESSRHCTQISSEYYDFEQTPLDAAHIKPLTKADMQEFYNRYLSPASKTRARISVHLHARGTSELGKKGLGLKQTSDEANAADTAVNGSSAAETAVEITDVRRYKASLQATAGARPWKPISDFEDGPDTSPIAG